MSVRLVQIVVIAGEVRKANRLLVSIGILSRALVSGSRGVLLLLRVLALII